MNALNNVTYENYVPAEYDVHECSILLWPYGDEYWRHNSEPIQNTIVELADIMSQYEDVYAGVHPEYISCARRKLPGRVKVFDVEYEDIYVRDITPTVFKKNGMRFAVDWRFNGWGGRKKGLCSSWEMDNSFGNKIAEYFDLQKIDGKIVCEGGALLFDGIDTLYITADSIVNINRNPHHDKEKIANEFKNVLPIKEVFWIKHGLNNDETDGHIDNLCSLANTNEFLLTWTDDPFNLQYNVCRDALDLLNSKKPKTNKRFIIHKIPIPNIKKRTKEECDMIKPDKSSIQRCENEELLGSYINFTHLNNAIIMPIFDVEEDYEVLRLFKLIFKNKEVIPFKSRELILGGGNIHCATAHIPK